MTSAAPVDVAIIGGGLSGLTLALDLSLRGIDAVVLEKNPGIDVYGIASRGIAYAQRTLEIFDRLGVAQRVVERGFTWSRGRIYVGDEELFRFDLEPDSSRRWPAFVNTQQLYVEEILVDRILEIGTADLRWSSRVRELAVDDDAVTLTVENPDREYTMRARWVVAADGARGETRANLGIESPVVAFEDTWCIVDVKIDHDELNERRFTLDSPLVEGGAVIQHRMGEGILRTDWQTARLADPDGEVTLERATARLRALLGTDDFEVVAFSPWRFKVRVMDRFVHDRVIFVGDAAHEIPPFGARGGNSGVQDADNLGWKLAAVLAGSAGPALLETYDVERVQAARANAGFAQLSARFISPRTHGERLWQDAVISVARRHAWARPMVNTGRLSTATTYTDSPLVLADDEPFAGGIVPGAAAVDGPVIGPDGPGFVLDHLAREFTAVVFAGDGPGPTPTPDPGARGVGLEVMVVGRTADRPRDSILFFDPDGSLHHRYGATPTATYLFRPDGHVVGRRPGTDIDDAVAMLERVMAEGA